MRNYDLQPDLRDPEYDKNTPELQWLEDSINYLAVAALGAVLLFCKLCFLVVCGVFSLFTKTKA